MMGYYPWASQAACRGKDPDWFVAPPDTNRRPSKALTEFYARAERICASCPVIEECREYAFSTIPASDNGIYAGMSPSRRKREGITWRRQRTAVSA